MEYAFRRFPTNDPSSPTPGEIHLQPRTTEPQAGRKLAVLALDRGPEAFVLGEPGDGPVERIVVKPDPTLDDMLAALFVERLLAGEKLPAGCRTFAIYAANVREGLKTTILPAKDSLEGIYLAIRFEAGPDLGLPEARAQFLADWSRMAQVILEAAEAGRDPATTPLFESCCHFDRARTFLANDRDIYCRQDLPRGERWLMRLPEGPGEEVPGLVLRRPRSVLWKAWSREDVQAPGGKGYFFLAVFEKEKHWVFSTDPVQRVAIQTLAGELQKAEAAKDSVRAARDPWYDGRRHSHTLVAAPHDGTMLADEEVLRVVKGWARCRPVGKRPRWKVPAMAAAAAVLVLIGALVLVSRGWLSTPSRELADSGEKPAAKSRGMEVVETNETVPAPAAARKGRDFALLIATDHYKGGWDNLTNPIADAIAIKKELEETYGFQVELVTDPTAEEILKAIRRQIKKMKASGSPEDQLFIFMAGHGTFDEETKEGFVVASDSALKDIIHTTYCAHSRLKDMIDSIPCQHILVVLDVCFGGTFDQFIAKTDRGGDVYREASAQELVRKKMRYKTRRYLTSGGKQYVPDGRPGQHSPFSRRLLEALRSGVNKRGILTLASLLHQVETVEPQPRAGEFGSNEPGSDFLFIVKAKATSGKEAP